MTGAPSNPTEPGYVLFGLVETRSDFKLKPETVRPGWRRLNPLMRNRRVDRPEPLVLFRRRRGSWLPPNP